MIFKKIVYDTQFPDEANNLNFFSESNQNDQSVTSMDENETIKWLFKNDSFFDYFAEEFFESTKNVKAFFNLTEPFTLKNKKPGDIDIMLVDTEYPERSIVFECKKVKALSSVFLNTKINGIQKIKNGITQTKFYKDIGFHQCYLMIILLDDGRFYDNQNLIFRNTKNEYLQEMFNIPRTKIENEYIGIVFVKIEQTTGKHIDLAGNISFCVDRRAKHVEQSDSITNKVKLLLEI